MSPEDKAAIILLVEKLRLLESEIFRVSAKHGVTTVDELDLLIEKGKISEEEIGEDLFAFDWLVSQKKEAERELKNRSFNLKNIWENFQNMLALPKLSLVA